MNYPDFNQPMMPGMPQEQQQAQPQVQQLGPQYMQPQVQQPVGVPPVAPPVVSQPQVQPQAGPTTEQVIAAIKDMIIPKLVERLQAAEGKIDELEKKVTDLVDVAKKPATRGKKTAAKKAEEQAPAPADSGVPFSGTVVDMGIINQLDEKIERQETREAAEAAQQVAVPTAEDIATAQALVAAPQNAVVAPQVIDGVPINAQALNAVNYMMQQGVTDPTQIASHLQTSVNVVQYIMSLPVEAQQSIMAAFPVA